jgi:hypothetical protein
MTEISIVCQEGQHKEDLRSKSSINLAFLDTLLARLWPFGQTFKQRVRVSW